MLFFLQFSLSFLKAIYYVWILHPWCFCAILSKENDILFHHQIRELIVPKIKFKARKLQLDWWYVTLCTAKCKQASNGWQESHLLFHHWVPWDLYGSLLSGSIRRGRPCIQHASCATGCCHTLAWAYLGLSQSSPRLLAWSPQLPAGTHVMLAVPLGETKRNWGEGNQESSSKSWRSPWPRNLSVPPSCPRKHQSRERAWRKAAAASVARKTSTCSQKRKAGKLKKTAISMPKSKRVWPSMLGLSWGGWGGSVQGRVKQLRGNSKASLSPCLWDGGYWAVTGSRCMGHAALTCVQLNHIVLELCANYALSYGAAMQVRKHDGSKLQVPHALPFSDVVFMQMTKILAFPHCSLFRATNLILGNLLPSCTCLQYNK